ncbi:MAG: phenylalanine--tRNA ligase subunit alpha [Erysipelotrichaceae bacterium]|nr:phenylalanine--tRNA ligase subunit alpha [Erysipelotrichaceae bacterium]
MLVDKLNELKEEVKLKVDNANDTATLLEIKNEFLSKKGKMSSFMSELKNVPNEEKPAMGNLINEAKKFITNLIENKQKTLQEKELEEKLQSERIDVTLPGYNYHSGSKHPMNIVVDEIIDIFLPLGYSVVEGPEVETDKFNFEYLNIPLDHPARAMQDTFYITPELLLRTQTSGLQARAMQANTLKTPLKIICPGKVYRRDDDDATHSHQFMQIETLVVGKDVSLANLKQTLDLVAKKMFGEKRSIRLRSSYFPFTEPSVEVDVSCACKNKQTCPICKGTGWIEILGAGMVHPNVLKMSGYDPDVYSGYAIGFGVDRITMLKYGFDDIRQLYNNDLRVISQFVKER